MNISATNNINFFAKLRKIHKTGEYTGRLPDNPYMGKIKKLNNFYKREVNLIYNPYNRTKFEPENQVANLNNLFYDAMAVIERKRGLKARRPLEY